MMYHSVAVLVVGFVLCSVGVAAEQASAGRQAENPGENRGEVVQVVQEVQGGEQAVLAALELMVRELREELGLVSSSVSDAMGSLERTLENHRDGTPV